MTRGLVVEGEGFGCVRGGRKADLGEAGGEGDPVEGWGDGVGIRETGRGGGGGREVGGMEGVGEEGVLDVGGDELLVLLLVVEAEGDAADGFGIGRGAASRRVTAASTWAR